MTQTTVTASVTRTKIWPMPKGMALVDACFFVLIPRKYWSLFVSNGNFRGLLTLLHRTWSCRSQERVNTTHITIRKPAPRRRQRRRFPVCDSDGKRVHPGKIRSRSVLHVRNKHGNDGVVSDSDEQRAEDHGERKGLFSHSEQWLRRGKTGRKDRDQQFFGSFALRIRPIRPASTAPVRIMIPKAPPTTIRNAMISMAELLIIPLYI